MTARKSFWLYKNAVSSRKKIKVKKGQTFKVMKCYVNGSKVRFQIKLTNGKKGWLKSPKKFLKRPLIKETIMRVEIQDKRAVSAFHRWLVHLPESGRIMSAEETACVLEALAAERSFSPEKTAKND